MGPQPGEAMSLFIVLKRKKTQLDSREMEMEFAMISAPTISHITPEKMKKVTLKKYSQKERLPGFKYANTLYFFQQET